LSQRQPGILPLQIEAIPKEEVDVVRIRSRQHMTLAKEERESHSTTRKSGSY